MPWRQCSAFLAIHQSSLASPNCIPHTATSIHKTPSANLLSKKDRYASGIPPAPTNTAAESNLTVDSAHAKNFTHMAYVPPPSGSLGREPQTSITSLSNNNISPNDVGHLVDSESQQSSHVYPPSYGVYPQLNAGQPNFLINRFGFNHYQSIYRYQYNQVYDRFFVWHALRKRERALFCGLRCSVLWSVFFEVRERCARKKPVAYGGKHSSGAGVGGRRAGTMESTKSLASASTPPLLHGLPQPRGVGSRNLTSNSKISTSAFLTGNPDVPGNIPPNTLVFDRNMFTSPKESHHGKRKRKAPPVEEYTATYTETETETETQTATETDTQAAYTLDSGTTIDSQDLSDSGSC